VLALLPWELSPEFLTQRHRDSEAQRNRRLSPCVFFVQILHINHSCACALTGRVAILAAREGAEAIKANKIATSVGSVPTSTCHTGRGERPPGVGCAATPGGKSPLPLGV